jgi:hypothetical protein
MRRFVSFLFSCGILIAQLSLSTAVGGSSVNRWNDDKNIISILRTKFEKLTPSGRFATGAFLGFSGWRFVEKSIGPFVRGAGVAYCVTEILHQTGWTAKRSRVQNGDHTVTQMQESFKQVSEDYRSYVRRQLDPKSLRKKIDACMEYDKHGSTGFATGIFAGMLL